MTAPLVSVIVPAYNYARYLDDALGSVRDQTYQRWECIVVDDGSTDDTAAVARRWAASDGRFRLVQHVINKGVSASRNRGFAESRGDFIQFLDADDRLLTETISRHVRFLEEHPQTGVVYSEAAFFRDEAPERLRPSRYGTLSRSIVARVHGSEEAWSKLEHYNICPIQCAMFRRDAIERTGSFEETSAGFEDWDFLLRCAAAGLRFDFSGGEQPCVAIRAHPRGA
ncbi:MAG TPA: glycosyltransferase family 2 protein, partial [Thermoanaerobaculia bacterium]|nr:glycosyltransferase family 2 protein [Thermoanaerobaculia bacterium]